MRSLMAMDASARRVIAAILFLVVVLVAGAIWRGDDPGLTAAQVLAVLVGGGFVLGCYLWARRHD
jgi:hypothetical protein